MALRNHGFTVPFVVVAALVLSFVASALLLPPTARAVEPIDLREVDRRLTSPDDPDSVRDLLHDVSSTPKPTPAATPRPIVIPTVPPMPEPVTEIGYDISYPQCGREYPDDFAFAIVGVNGGRVHSTNPCLGTGEHASQLAWAGEDAEFYANTGNPGPDLSAYWPHGVTEPRACDTADSPGSDTGDCAYVYGWNAAQHAYATALDAAKAVGLAETDADRLAGAPTWWLDVEDANSWRGDRELNVAALQGAVAYLESVGVGEVGFYSTPRLWDRITGGTDAFADHPSWHAGALGLEDARDRCGDTGFTGGELRMVQWVEDNLDANYRCP